MYHGTDGMLFGMGWGWLIGLLLLVLIIWLVVKATNQSASQNKPGKKSALDILKERYARGEISSEEFEEKEKSIS